MHRLNSNSRRDAAQLNVSRPTMGRLEEKEEQEHVRSITPPNWGPFCLSLDKQGVN